MHLVRVAVSCAAVGCAATSTGWIWYNRGQYLPVTNTRFPAESYAIPDTQQPV